MKKILYMALLVSTSFAMEADKIGKILSLTSFDAKYKDLHIYRDPWEAEFAESFHKDLIRQAEISTKKLIESTRKDTYDRVKKFEFKLRHPGATDILDIKASALDAPDIESAAMTTAQACVAAPDSSDTKGK